MCVQNCGDFGYNYVGNPETQTCEYCGATCTLCSPKYGCLEDQRRDKLGFKYVLGNEYPTGQFPYSASAPSDEFRTTKACADDRCKKCQDLDAQDDQCDVCFKYVNFYEEG